VPPFEEVRPGRRVACWKVSQGWPEEASEGVRA
jgi:hypothetical protein